MIKMIIVDDEEIAIKGLIALINWEQYGYTVIGEACNGVEALKLFEGTIPDVIITDIRMPIMDGLELMKEINKSFPSIRVIVLSGYDEFQYVKAAIDNSAVGYILKPIEEEEIAKVLIKVGHLVTSEKRENQSKKQILLNVKKNYLVNLIEGLASIERYGNSNEDISLKDLEIYFESNDFCVIILSVISTNKHNMDKSRIIDRGKEILNKFYSGEIIDKCEDEIYILLEGEESILQRNDIFQELRKEICAQGDMSLTIAVGNAFKGLENIKNSYTQAREALGYSISLGMDATIEYKMLKELEVSGLTYPLQLEIKIINALTSNKENIEETVSDFLKLVGKNRVYSLYEFENIVIELMVALKHYLISFDADKLVDMKLIMHEISSKKDIESIENYMKDLLIQFGRAISEYSKNTGTSIIHDAMDYIRDHYNTGVTLDEICQKFYISKSHFCRVFKNETGLSFKNYLNLIRIEKSKELLKILYYKNYEICTMVGLEDPAYFNHLFKKTTGMTPMEYRNL